MQELLQTLFVPSVATALWIGLLVTFVTVGDASRLLAPRNLALAFLLGLSVPLADILRLGRPGSGVAGRMFTVIFLYSIALAAWSAVLSRRPAPPAWRANLSRNGLRALVLALVVLDTGAVLGHPPDDAGVYSNLATQRWLETGSLPYVDTLLTGPESPAHGASATYGPLLYLAHIPFQMALGRPDNPPGSSLADHTYRWPNMLATKLACLAFHLLGLWALFGVVRRMAGEELGLAAVALYAGSPYILGLGGEVHQVAGLTYISHIAPTALMLAGLLAAERPLLSGALLGAATGVLFWPASIFPAWFGWYAWRRRGAWLFAAGFAAVGVVCGALVMWGTHTSNPVTALHLLAQSTIEHVEGTGARQYGSSLFGFWGTHPALKAIFQQPLLGSTSLLKPSSMLFGAAALGAFFAVKGRTLAQLAAVTAVLGVLVQGLWKTNAGGTFVAWYLPFLLIAMLCGDRRDPATDHAAR